MAKVTTSKRTYAPRLSVLLGTLTALAAVAVLSAIMFALRSHLSIATVALILILPVVAGVVIGGMWAGAGAAVGGFVVYDVFFIPPYGTLAVGRAEDWVALFVYLAVVAILGRVTNILAVARAEASQRQLDAERMLGLSELLVGERPLGDLLASVSRTVRDTLGYESVVVLLPSEDGLEVAAAAGTPLGPDELASIKPSAGRVTAVSGQGRRLQSIVLQTSGRPVGVLGLAGEHLGPYQERLLMTFANETAVAIERANLHEEALRARVLEEANDFREALLGAVSHDLRTPLATIKSSASTLRDPNFPLDADAADELTSLIEAQADRLSRMVSNLLDLSRVRAGVLELRRGPVQMRQVVSDALALLRVPPERVKLEGLDVADDLTPADVDAGLVVEAVVNLIDNALRYAPPDEPVVVSATPGPGVVAISVVDRGPGVAAELRDRLIEGPQPGITNRTGGIGLGLVITRAFVEANGGRLTVEDEPGGGTRATIEVPSYRGGAPQTALGDDE